MKEIMLSMYNSIEEKKGVFMNKLVIAIGSVCFIGVTGFVLILLQNALVQNQYNQMQQASLIVNDSIVDIGVLHTQGEIDKVNSELSLEYQDQAKEMEKLVDDYDISMPGVINMGNISDNNIDMLDNLVKVATLDTGAYIIDNAQISIEVDDLNKKTKTVQGELATDIATVSNDLFASNGIDPSTYDSSTISKSTLDSVDLDQDDLSMVTDMKSDVDSKISELDKSSVDYKHVSVDTASTYDDTTAKSKEKSKGKGKKNVTPDVPNTGVTITIE